MIGIILYTEIDGGGGGGVGGGGAALDLFV